ncbi:IPT/TIG domain-containing protein [Actinosynnema sp. NPDC023587]|uniref:IPT/TIG domain-containing protein n=1 Tax=Actinosynnema sp. NPDC023587 TaxID=3154695 RepID=UPI0033E96763
MPTEHSEAADEGTPRVRDSPHLDRLDPPSGPAIGSTPVKLTGTLLQHVVEVRFGVSPGTDVRARSPVEVTCVTPAHSAGVVQVVAVDDQQNVSNPLPFEFLPPPE